MLSKTAEVFASSLSLKCDESSAFGIYRNYFITFYEKKRNRVVDISCSLGDRDENSINYLELSDSIKENLEKFQIEDYELSEECVHLVSGADISLFRDMLDDVISTLTKNDVHGANYCSNCDKPFVQGNKKKVVSVNGQKHLLCDSCAFEMMEQSEEKNTDDAPAAAPIGKVILGAVAGAVIGLIVYVALFFVLPTDTTGILQYLVCLAGLAVGALTFYVCRAVSKSGFTKAFTAVVIVSSALFTAVAHYVGCVVYAVRSYSTFAVFSFNASPFLKLVFSNNALLRFYVAGTVISLCAVAFVLIFAVSSLMKKSTATKKPQVSITTIK